MGAVQYFREAGIQIPKDISLIVYDDYDWARIFTPPITVVRQEAFEMGRKSARLLIDRMNKKEEEEKKEIIQLETQLIKRNSCRRKE